MQELIKERKDSKNGRKEVRNKKKSKMMRSELRKRNKYGKRLKMKRCILKIEERQEKNKKQ